MPTTNDCSDAAINPTTGVFTWTPNESQGPGSYTFQVKVTDNGTGNLSDAKTITINVLGETSIEDHEQLSVILSEANGAIVDRSTASGTILNDDTSLG